MNVLTDKNYQLYAAKHYNSIQCLDESEFFEDLKRITYIKRHCTKYSSGGNLHLRLLLNHVIIMSNIFGPSATADLLYLKAKQHMSILKPILLFIGAFPETINNVINEGIIHTDEISKDSYVVSELRKI